MAEGNEIILGWPLLSPNPYIQGDLKTRLEKASNDEETDMEDIVDSLNDLADDKTKEFQDKLIEAQKACFLRMGFDFTKLASKKDFIYAETPEGSREFKTFEIESAFDPFGCFESPSDGLIGISVCSRYFPIFADWRDPNGGIYLIRLSPPLEELSIAQEEIVKFLPEFETANYYVKLIYY